jgi:hypothetical protein
MKKEFKEKLSRAIRVLIPRTFLTLVYRLKSLND